MPAIAQRPTVAQFDPSQFELGMEAVPRAKTITRQPTIRAVAHKDSGQFFHMVRVCSCAREFRARFHWARLTEEGARKAALKLCDLVQQHRAEIFVSNWKTLHMREKPNGLPYGVFVRHENGPDAPATEYGARVAHEDGRVHEVAFVVRDDPEAARRAAIACRLGYVQKAQNVNSTALRKADALFRRLAARVDPHAYVDVRPAKPSPGTPRRQSPCLPAEAPIPKPVAILADLGSGPSPAWPHRHRARPTVSKNVHGRIAYSVVRACIFGWTFEARFHWSRHGGEARASDYAAAFATVAESLMAGYQLPIRGATLIPEKVDGPREQLRQLLSAAANATSPVVAISWLQSNRGRKISKQSSDLAVRSGANGN